MFKSSTNKQLVKERRDELNLYLQALSQKEDFAHSQRFIQWLSPDHNPTFIPTKSTTVHSGWLWKQGHVRKNWKWRWFVLKAQFLFYYRSKQAIQPRGAVPLQSCITETSDLKEFCIKLQPDPKCEAFYLRAETQEDIMVWYKKLRKASSVTKKGRPLSTVPTDTDSPDFLRRPLRQTSEKTSSISIQPTPLRTTTSETLKSHGFANSAPKTTSKLSVKYSPKTTPRSPTKSPKSPRAKSKADPKSPPKPSPKLSPKTGSMTPPAQPKSKITKATSFRLSPKKPRPSSPKLHFRNQSNLSSEAEPSRKEGLLGQPAIPEGKLSSAALNLLAASPYVDSVGKKPTGELPVGSPRRPYSMAPSRERENKETSHLGLPPSVAAWLNSVIKGESSSMKKDSAIDEMRATKESVDKELAVISSKITEFLKSSTGVSEADRQVYLRTQQIIVKISKLTINNLLEENTCEEIIKMLQNEMATLESKEFLVGVLFSFSRLSLQVSWHVKTSSAKSLHDMEEKANSGCTDEFPTDSISRRRTTMGHSTSDPPLPQNHASARKRRQSLFPATRPVSPNLLNPSPTSSLNSRLDRSLGSECSCEGDQESQQERGFFPFLSFFLYSFH